MITNIWSNLFPYMIDNFNPYVGDHIWASIYALAPGIHMLPTYDHMFVYMVYRHMILMPVYGPIYWYSDIWFPYMGRFSHEMRLHDVH